MREGAAMHEGCPSPPSRAQAAYLNMLSYSPLDNVARQAYPHLLLTAGVNPRPAPAAVPRFLAPLNTTPPYPPLPPLPVREAACRMLARLASLALSAIVGPATARPPFLPGRSSAAPNHASF